MSKIQRLSNAYHRWVAAHPTASEDFVDAIEDLLVDAGVTFDRVVARVKTWPSLKAKAKRRTDPDPWRDIHDVVGVRVTTFHSTEIPVALTVLAGSFTVLKSVDKTAETRIAGDFGYGSHHLVLRVPEEAEGPVAGYAGFTFEVQVRTVLQHAWAEFEHDIRYKRGTVTPDPRVDRAFTLAAGLIELADQQFDQIAALQGPAANPADDVELSPEALPGILSACLTDRFPRSRSQDYHWLHEVLVADGVTTVGQLRSLISPEAIAELSYEYRPGHVRVVDDLLLAELGERHIDATGHTGRRATKRPGRLRQRLAAMRAGATRA